MELALIGLGKMGFNLAQNFVSHGHNVRAFDLNPDLVASAAKKGIEPAANLTELIQAGSGRRVIWLMIPAGTMVDDTLHTILPLLSPGDIVVDGGNSYYKDSVRRAKDLAEKGFAFLDCGTSGGTSGARHGICAMIGGDKEAFSYCELLFKDIAIENGYLYCGPSGAGHFVKMVHNGIEYGMMQSIAEGFEVMQKSEFGLDLRAVAELFNHGSVVRSWLMELTARALSKDPELSSIKGIMHSSGEGKWTLETALEKQIPTPVIALSVLMRYRSLEEDTFSGKIVAALRNEFGGHAVVRDPEK